MRIKSKKLISLFLSILMILSIVPTNILADNIWVNMDGYNSSGGGGGGGRIETRFVNNLNSMNGYKVSIWYCPQTGTETVIEHDKGGTEKIHKLPSFDWSADANAAFQAGNTIYLRRQDIITKQGEYVLPNVYNIGTIYSQTTLGHNWNRGLTKTSKKRFEYFSTGWAERLKNNSPYEYQNLVDSFVEMKANALKSVWSYIPFGKKEEHWTKAEQGLVDWVQRLYNMNDPKSVNIDDIKEDLSYGGKPFSEFGVKDAESFQLCFPEAMAKGSDKNYKKSIEYLRSYFLSPVILNEIFYLSRLNVAGEKGEISVKDFLVGTYKYEFVNEKGELESYYNEKGEYKLYIEPVAYRAYNDTDGLMCMSWRDMMLEHQSKNGKKNGFVSMNDFATQFSNAFDLAERDVSLQYNGVVLGEKNGTFKRTGPLAQSQVIPTAKDNLNTLGAAVITSPSLAAYIPFYDPEIISTYVMLTGVNEDGSFKYVKYADTDRDTADFYWRREYDENNVPKLYTTNIPKIDNEVEINGGTAYLNDIITTDKLIDINSETEWVNTDIISGVTIRDGEDKRELRADSNDIVGYRVGILTGSDLFVDSVVDVSADKIYRAMKENETFNAKDIGSVADMVKIVEKCSEKQTMNLNSGLMRDGNNLNFLKGATVSAIGSSDSIYKNVQNLLNKEYIENWVFNNDTGLDLTLEQYEYAKKLIEDLSESDIMKLFVSGIECVIDKNKIAGLIAKGSENREAIVYDTILGSEDGYYISLDEDYMYRKQSENNDRFIHEYVKDNVLSLGFVYYEDEGLRAANRTLTNSFRYELLEKHLGQELTEEVDKILSTPKTANTVILRYIVIPTAQQVDVVDLYRNGQKIGTIVGEKQTLELNGKTATIQKPKVTVDGTPKLVEYVSNGDYPMKEVTDGVLPTKSTGGVEGTMEGTISDYPIEPLPHNLYVKWKVELKDPDGEDLGGLTQSVPEWRLSKFFGTNSIDNGYTYMTLPITYGCCGNAKLDGTTANVSRPYTVVNPNGKVNDGTYSTTNMKYKSWLHSATENTGSTDSVGVDKATSIVTVDGIINAVKSTETSGLKSVNWLQSEWTNNNYLNSGYDIQSSSVSGQFDSSEHQKYVLSDTLKLNTLNTKSYSNTWPYYRSRKRGHGHRWTGSKTISTTSPSYIPYYLDTEIIFERYNQVNTDSRLLTVPSKTEVENAYTTLVYQPGDIMKVYPEYGMLFTSDSNDGDTNADRSSIKWMVGDQARSIKPAIYQTLRFKVFVQPNSTGSSVATDSRALTARNKISDATAKNKQIVYKGSSVNTAFQLYRDSSRNNAALLTLKTFALDYNDSIKTSDNKTVQNAWGMDGYKPENYHTNLMNNLNKKATAYEKLYIKEDGATYNGGVKQQQTNNFELSGSNYTTFNHELIIRGGKLIGVRVQDRNDKSYIPMTMEQLKANNSYADLYDAIIETKLYNESNDKNATVLSTFEHQTGNALSEQLYADKLEQARQLKDGLPSATPDSSKVVVNSGWYSEDTTVLVMKEFVTNYKVPSISFSDKLSLQITGLNTPMDKSLFFNKVARGHVYLKYDLGLKTAMGENTNVYFEYNSNNDYKISNKVYIADTERKLGYIGTDYLVPNVSITDTTRQ